MKDVQGALYAQIKGHSLVQGDVLVIARVYLVRRF